MRAILKFFGGSPLFREKFLLGEEEGSLGQIFFGRRRRFFQTKRVFSPPVVGVQVGIPVALFWVKFG
jgi:hypothetical protein